MRFPRVLLILIITACGPSRPTAPPPKPAPPASAVEDIVSPAAASGFSRPNGLDWPADRAKAPASGTFKNVPLLGTLPSERVMTAMQSMEPNLGVACDHCHDQDFTSDGKQPKVTARVMLRMNHEIDTRYFGGRTQVTCFTCHRHEPTPEPFKMVGTPRSWPLPPLDAGAAAKPAREVYANLKVLGDLPASSIQPAMLAFSEALGVKCDHCHTPKKWADDDKPAKGRAREMMAMVGAIGEGYFPGKESKVHCATCHRGDATPQRVAGPMMLVQATLPDGKPPERARFVVGPPELAPKTFGELREATQGPLADRLSGISTYASAEAELGRFAPGTYSLCSVTLPADRKAARDPKFAATPVTCAPMTIAPSPDVQTVTRQLAPL